jgi:hypothetical protein
MWREAASPPVKSRRAKRSGRLSTENWSQRQKIVNFMNRKKFVPFDCRESIPGAHVSRSALANQGTIPTAISQVNPSNHL